MTFASIDCTGHIHCYNIIINCDNFVFVYYNNCVRIYVCIYTVYQSQIGEVVVQYINYSLFEIILLIFQILGYVYMCYRARVSVSLRNTTHTTHTYT